MGLGWPPKVRARASPAVKLVQVSGILLYSGYVLRTAPPIMSFTYQVRDELDALKDQAVLPCPGFIGTGNLVKSSSEKSSKPSLLSL